MITGNRYPALSFFLGSGCITVQMNAIFNYTWGDPIVMNLQPIISIFFIIVVLVAFSGCTGSNGVSSATTIPTPDIITPVKATPVPVTQLPASEVARITVEHFGLNPSTESIYEFLGKVQVDAGIYRSVKVVLRYPDMQEYVYDAGGMGGSNATVKPIYLYPDQRYMGTNPEKIIELDGRQYTTIYRYENGVLVWAAMRENAITQK